MARIESADIGVTIEKELIASNPSWSTDIAARIRSILGNIAGIKYGTQLAVKKITANKGFTDTFKVCTIDSNHQPKDHILTINIVLAPGGVATPQIMGVVVYSYDARVTNTSELIDFIKKESQTHEDKIERDFDMFFTRISQYGLSEEDLADIMKAWDKLPFESSYLLRDKLKRIAKVI